jgi:hypothetical protein
MLFAIGYIAGIATAILIVTTLMYLRRRIEPKAEAIQRAIEEAGPRPKGFIVEPLDEGAEARERIVARNRAAGKDTPISELQ